MDENLIYISDDNINIFGKTYINFNEYIKSDNILQVFQSCDNVIILTKDNMILIFRFKNTSKELLGYNNIYQRIK